MGETCTYVEPVLLQVCSVPEAVKAAARIGAARTYFTHISHELGHVTTSARLPRGVELAYDGLVLEIP